MRAVPALWVVSALLCGRLPCAETLGSTNCDVCPDDFDVVGNSTLDLGDNGTACTW